MTIVVDGTPLEAFAGETVAIALLASGCRVLRHTFRFSAPRGLFCAMGACFDCLVTVDGRPGVKACMTFVRPGMTVSTESDGR